MRKASYILGLLYLFQVTVVVAALPEPKPPVVMNSLWLAPDYISRKPRYVVKFSDNNGQFEGLIVKVVDENMNEVPNPICVECVGPLKNISLIGARIVYSLKRDGKEYRDGYLLDPLSGNVYDSKVWSKDEGAKLQLRAYSGFFFRTLTWKKIN
jgi:uncharacterized protein (DUF2147 family)